MLSVVWHACWADCIKLEGSDSSSMQPEQYLPSYKGLYDLGLHIKWERTIATTWCMLWCWIIRWNMYSDSERFAVRAVSKQLETWRSTTTKRLLVQVHSFLFLIDLSSLDKWHNDVSVTKKLNARFTEVAGKSSQVHTKACKEAG